MTNIDTPAPADAAAITEAEKPEAPEAPVLGWNDLGLSEAALELIRKAGFEKPTPVQQQSIPLAMQGFDLICSAQTGTGKTASFVLPMVEKFAGREGTYGLILSPTREIAQQTQATLELFGTPRGVRSCVLIGGVDMRYDTIALATYPQIIVATPGRLCDHLDRGNIWLDYIESAVLDEADRMLDMGFSDQLNRIMEDVPKSRQTMLFSATFPPAVDKFAKKILHEPRKVSIGKPMAAAGTVEQRIWWMKEEDKVRELLRLMREEKGSIIIFCRSKDLATRLWRQLHSRTIYDATFIHSDRPQDQREQALAEFKEGKYRVLIATDVAARGIHVDGVAHVVNYDLPFEPEDYVHRIGRTGRAEARGHATSFVTMRDRNSLRAIEKLINKGLPTEFGGTPGAAPEMGADSEGDRGGRGERGGRGGRSGGGGGRGGRGSRGGQGRSGGGGGGGNLRSEQPNQTRDQPAPPSAQPRPPAAPNAGAPADGAAPQGPRPRIIPLSERPAGAPPLVQPPSGGGQGSSRSSGQPSGKASGPIQASIKMQSQATEDGSRSREDAGDLKDPHARAPKSRRGRGPRGGGSDEGSDSGSTPPRGGGGGTAFPI